ncbi:mesenchyme-specific cell surface glycoprotein-like [Ylistrum balloti]|uniref:mesenchyme-specific cell surface glycoprotein-like n=1 Tax=Ylistrum balloti TaxID=509963 RepID=UPI002905A48F|nr:mesenchyme-specific cell surface glycoprotein-like [Ylistrum balloti]
MMINENSGLLEVYRIENTGTHTRMHSIPVGVRPDMIMPTSDCRTVVFAVEGNAYNNGSHFIDPEGAIGIIRFPHADGIAGSYQYTQLDFRKFNDAWQDLVSRGARFIYRENNNKFSNDVEPEYITFNTDESIAYVSLQENNAVAEVDLITLNITAIHPLGFKNWTESKLDVSDKDKGINIRQWPVMGMYQPDVIKFVTIGDKSYLLTANEGATKDYSDIEGSGGFNEASRVEDLTIDDPYHETAHVPFWASQNGFFWNLQTEKNLGRLVVSNLEGKHDNVYDDLFTFGGRSISLYDTSTFTQVYDSGSDVEEKIAQYQPDLFNANGKPESSIVSKTKDARSDARGPEVECLAVAKDGDSTVIFVGIERPGLIAIYSIPGSDVNAIKFESLWSGIPKTNETYQSLYNQRVISDVGLDDLRYIPANESPNNKPLLLSTASTSGTVSIFEIKGLTGPIGSGNVR